MLRNDSPNRKVIYKSDETERTLVEKYTYLTSEPNLHRITVHNATEEDAGAYICQLVQSREKQTGFITVVSKLSVWYTIFFSVVPLSVEIWYCEDFWGLLFYRH